MILALVVAMRHGRSAQSDSDVTRSHQHVTFPPKQPYNIILELLLFELAANGIFPDRLVFESVSASTNLGAKNQGLVFCGAILENPAPEDTGVLLTSSYYSWNT